MRILIDLPERDVQTLDQIGKARKASRAQIIREAVGEFLRARAADAGADAFGLWKDRRLDGLDYQRQVRDEW